MRRSFLLLPLAALVGCHSDPTYPAQYPAYAYPTQQAPACQPLPPCAPGYRPYPQYSNYVPPGPPPIQQANFQGPPAPPATQEPPR
jgi:hypothetical protein